MQPAIFTVCNECDECIILLTLATAELLIWLMMLVIAPIKGGAKYTDRAKEHGSVQWTVSGRKGRDRYRYRGHVANDDVSKGDWMDDSSLISASSGLSCTRKFV